MSKRRRAQLKHNRRQLAQRNLRLELLDPRLTMHGVGLDAPPPGMRDFMSICPVSGGYAGSAVLDVLKLPDLIGDFSAGGSTGGDTASPAAAKFPLTSVPVLNSLLGASATLYLDFTGHFDAVWGSSNNVSTPVFDQDGDLTTFSTNELATMQTIWQIVAEDYSPFKINVSTVEPPSFANGAAMRVAIGGAGAWSGGLYGGISYIDSFTNYIVNTAYVFSDNLANGNARYTAEAVSHEAGHAFGLLHQSQYNTSGGLVDDYYAGSGDGRAPIMGDSYSATRGLWWYGTSTSANTYQDDMAVISKTANGFGYRADDVGNTATTATALTVDGNQLSGAGVITKTTDVDCFSFSTGAGQVSLSVNVVAGINDLDARIELRDAVGTLITSAAPTNSFGATITTTLAAGSYRVVVASNGGYGDVGQYTVSGTVVPGGTSGDPGVSAPTSLTAAVNANGVYLAWADNANNETNYEVQTSTDHVNWTTLATLSADSTSYTATNLAAGASGYFRVRAGNLTQTSGFSNEVQATRAPLAPGNVALVVASATQINLSWTDVAGETGYKVQRSTDDGSSWTTVATTSANATSYQNTGLAPSTTYSYRLVATNAGGDSAPSSVVTGTTPILVTVPAVPSQLVVTTGAREANLSWRDNSANENGFSIYRSSNGSTWTLVGSVSANATTFVDTTVASRATYSYRVAAFNDVGTSGFSNAVRITMPRIAPLPVTPPSDLTIGSVTTRQVQLTWTDNSNNETNFRVERSTNGGKTWSTIGTTKANVTSFTDGAVVRDRSYTYRVRGLGEAGLTNPTNVVTVTVPRASTVATGSFATVMHWMHFSSD